MGDGETEAFEEIVAASKKGRRQNSLRRDYVRFDEVEDVLASTDLMALTTPLVLRHPSYWKWTIVGAHNALQGAMVCALCDTTRTSVLTEKSAQEMLAWLEKRDGPRGKPPRERLAEFAVLLRRCTAGQTSCEKLVLAPGRLRDILRLHEDFRNSFAHFTPKGWSIETAGLPRIIGAALDAIEELMSRRQVSYRMSGNRRRRLNRALGATRGSLAILTV